MEARRSHRWAGPCSRSALIALALSVPAPAQLTSLESLTSSDSPLPGDSFDPAISMDGRYVAFMSYPDWSLSQIYLRDRFSGVTELLSVHSNGSPGNSYSYAPSLSADLRFVAFSSWANNLVNGDTNGTYPNGHDIFVRDRLAGTTERVSVSSGEIQANDQSYLSASSISADGRYVVFYSHASNLVAGDSNAAADVFLRDRQAGTTERVSLGSGGQQGNGASEYGSISADARWVAFISLADNLVPGDTNSVRDVFVRDLLTGKTERVSVDSSELQANAESSTGSISADGRFVAFHSTASNLVAGDSNVGWDVFLRDRRLGTTERVSVGSSDAQANGDSWALRISPDGRYLSFQSKADNLVALDTNGKLDVFVRDLKSATTERMSVATNGAQADGDSWSGSITPDSRFVAFTSRASLVEQDTNTWHDIYVRDRSYSPMSSLCEPGSNGVIACPCSNPPSESGRGCDNSALTGGALLVASGVASLSADTLVFTTADEKPTALSIVLQGDAFLGAGIAFGQGVSCVGGTFKRLYIRTATGGSISAPNFGAGDPSVSAVSATLGDPIQPGQTRWYIIYYRDPIVLGGCPPSSTFNSTLSGEVTWLP